MVAHMTSPDEQLDHDGNPFYTRGCTIFEQPPEIPRLGGRGSYALGYGRSSYALGYLLAACISSDHSRDEIRQLASGILDALD